MLYRQRFGEHVSLIRRAAVFQVVVGGVLVFLAGWVIGVGAVPVCAEPVIRSPSHSV